MCSTTDSGRKCFQFSYSVGPWLWLLLSLAAVMLSSHSLPGAAPDIARAASARLISLSHEVQSCYSCYLYFTDEEAGN